MKNPLKAKLKAMGMAAKCQVYMVIVRQDFLIPMSGVMGHQDRKGAFGNAGSSQI